ESHPPRTAVASAPAARFSFMLPIRSRSSSTLGTLGRLRRSECTSQFPGQRGSTIVRHETADLERLTRRHDPDRIAPRAIVFHPHPGRSTLDPAQALTT